MNILNKTVSAVALALAATTIAAPAMAQTAAATAPALKGIGVVNLDAVVANSNAYKAADTQRQTTYKAQIDQANTRAQAIQAQIQPLYAKYQADAQAPNANQAALQQQVAAMQQIQQNGERELAQILAPVQLSRAYVVEQIEDKIGDSLKNVMTKQQVAIVLPQDATVAFQPAQNLNQALLNELNAAIPSATLVPPAGWLPREQREQQARAQQAQGQQPAQQPATRAPVGR